MGASDDIRAPHPRSRDFLGVFAVVEREGRILMVQNARRIGGSEQLVWDLPGGQVEDGELLHEALQRELREETGVGVVGAPRFLFVQEGERRRAAQRAHAWRSFFFGCEVRGDAVAGSEVLAVAWYRRAELPALLTAPYHDSFGVWLARGGAFFGSCWRD